MNGEIDYGAVFGLPDTDSGAGANEQGSAAPASDEAAQGANEQDSADTASTDTDTAEDDTTAGDGGDDGTDNAAVTDAPDGAKQNPVENSAYAAIRRKAEADAAEKFKHEREELERQSAASLDSAIEALGLSDPYTNEKITTKAQLEKYRAKTAAEKTGKELENAGLTKETIDGIISEHPAIKAARELEKSMKAAEEKAQLEAARAKGETQIREISEKYNPEIKSLADILAMPTGGKFREYVTRGIDFADAYRLANLDEITSRAASGAARHAAMNTASKDHLARSAERGRGTVSVPAKTMELYKMLMPNLSEAEYSAHYNKNHKEK